MVHYPYLGQVLLVVSLLASYSLCVLSMSNSCYGFITSLWLYACSDKYFSAFQEWKERKKFQKRLIAAKKKLCDMEQQHVFHGFRHGTKTQGTLLANQIVGVNSKLLQLALQNTEISSKR